MGGARCINAARAPPTVGKDKGTWMGACNYISTSFGSSSSGGDKMRRLYRSTWMMRTLCALLASWAMLVSFAALAI